MRRGTTHSVHYLVHPDSGSILLDHILLEILEMIPIKILGHRLVPELILHINTFAHLANVGLMQRARR
jgi:hypothetical protein